MGSSSHTSGTTSQQTHQTITPTNPSWATDPLQAVAGNVNGLAGADPHSFIAGADPLQQQAGTAAAGLTGTPGLYAGANDLTTSIGQMNAPDIASLMNPFKTSDKNQIINPALAGFDQTAALQNAQNHLNLGNDTTFGGSGASITNALAQGQQGLARGQLQGGLLSQMYDRALQGATAQAGINQNQQGLRLNAAGQLVNSANDQGQTNRANIATQGGIGSMLQGLTQANVGAPITTAGALSGILGSLPLGLVHGQNADGTMTGTTSGTTTTSNPLGSIGSLLQGAGALGGSGGLGSLFSLFGGHGGDSLAGLY